jgi:hypothetical protein
LGERRKSRKKKRKKSKKAQDKKVKTKRDSKREVARQGLLFMLKKNRRYNKYISVGLNVHANGSFIVPAAHHTLNG